MTTTETKVEEKMLARLVRTILKSGPLSWTAARSAMSATYNPIDAYFYNLRLVAWIAAGKIKTVETPNGDSTVTV